MATCVFSWLAMMERKVANIDKFQASNLKLLHYHTRHQCWHWSVQLWKNAKKTFETLKVAFGKQTMGITYVFEWFSKVKSGLTSVDLRHSLMSQTNENVDSVRKLVPKSKIMSICEVTDMLGISFEWVQRILRDNLNMHWIATKFMLYTCSLCTLCG